MSAKPPSPRPSTSHISHSGFVRSSALGEEAAGEVLQLLLAAGRGQAGVAQVVAQVEVRVVDPDRAALVERDLGEALAKARHEVQARLDVLAQLVVRRRRPVEDRDRRDVQPRARPSRGAGTTRRAPRCGGRGRCGRLFHAARGTGPVRSSSCRGDGSDRPSRRRRVLRERRAAAPARAARPAGDRVGQRAARGRHDGVLRGAPVRHRLGDADLAGAAAVPRRGPRRRRTSPPTARRRGRSWSSCARRSSASRSSASTRPTSTSTGSSRRARRCAGSSSDDPRRDRAWTARSGSAPTGSSRRSRRTPRSRAASSASRASRRARASPAHPPGLVPGIGPKTVARLERDGDHDARARSRRRRVERARRALRRQPRARPAAPRALRGLGAR